MLLKNLLFALVVALFLSAPAFAQEKTFNAESFTLGNGMDVVVIPNHRAPVVMHMVWLRAGSGDEQKGQSGAAHFVEHLMFKGTEKIAPGEFSKKVRALGGNDNAFTSYDFTAYHQSVAAEHLETMMEMEADRMTGLTFPQAEVDSEKLVVIEERRERTENDPRTFFYEQMRAALFVNHPYGTPVIGWFHEVDALNRPAVKSYYDAWYAPNNAILVVSGDITAEKLKPIAERTYGQIPRKEVPKRNWTTVPPLPGQPVLTMRHPTIRQPSLSRLYRVPSYHMSKPDSLALQVLQDAVSGGAATRFYKSLVVEKKLATGINLDYNGSQWSDATLAIGAVPADNVDMKDLEAAIDDELRALVKDGITDQEITEAKTRMKDAAAFARDSLSGPAMIFGAALTSGETIEDVEFWPANIDKVTTEQVQDVAKRFLDPDERHMRPYVTGYLLPTEEKTE